MKKFLIILGIIFGLIIVAGFTLPVIFKDDIKAAIDKELESSVNAYVQFDVDNFDLSVFRNFPSITASMKEFGVVNKEPFAGEILFAAQELNVEIDLYSLLFEETPTLSGITLISPIINIKVLEDGRANYDIAISNEADTLETEEASEFSLRIDHWEIQDGSIVYDDKLYLFYMKLSGFDHTGSGDFTQDVFDLVTTSHADSLWVAYDDIMYIEEKTTDIDATITISEDISRYEFKENKASLNDFALSFDGWFFMGEDSYDMDISYSAIDNSFKSLLSLVPGVYTEDFSSIETSGNLSLEGMVKGKYSDNEMPAFNLAMLVENAMFKYPDLPTAVENIALDMKVDNKDGIIDNTMVDIANFHMDFGNNPVDARLKIANLKDYQMDGQVKAKLNLSELSSMFPVEGIDMKGLFNLDLSASGTYDSTLNTMPIMNGTMSLADGYIKSSDFPLPLKDLHFASKLSNSTGKMRDFKAEVNDFTVIMDQEQFKADLIFSNLDNYTWDLNAKGSVDLKKITSLYPIEGMNLEGLITADIETKGNYALVEAEKYTELPTSGSLSLKDFKYDDDELPYDVLISSASGDFNPQSIALTDFTAKVGQSDMKLDGSISNYMGYIFNENEVLKGKFNFSSSYFNLNELMPEEDETQTEEDTTSYSIIPVPKDLDFELNSKITKLIYTDMELNNAQGTVIVKNGIANISELRFNTLGGSFLISGAYDTSEPDKPRYDFKLDIDDLGIKEAYQTFNAVKVFAPLAQNVTGKLSTDFNITGELKDNFMPKLETITGSGVLKIIQAALQESPLLNGLTSATPLKDADNVTLKNVMMRASIENGRLNVKPFDVTFAGYTATVSGSTGLDGAISYDMEMDVPASALGSNLSSFSSKLGIAEVDENTNIPVNIGIGGTYKNPKIQLLSSEQSEELKQVIADRAKEEAKDAGKEAIKSLAGEKPVSSTIKNLLGGEKTDSTATDSTKTGTTKEEVKTEVEEKAKEALKGIFKKKSGGN